MEGLENSSPFVAINFNIFIKPISSVVIKKFHMLTLVFTEKSNVSVCLLAQKTVHLGISFFFFHFGISWDKDKHVHDVCMLSCFSHV